MTLLLPTFLARPRAGVRRVRTSAALTLLLVACAHGVPARAFAQRLDAPAVVATSAAPSDTALAARAAAVGIAAGDRVRVKAWREPAYSDSTTVDERGIIVLPRVGALRVDRLTIAALRDTLRARYAVYLRDPELTVTVYRRVGLQGEVRAPGLYYLDVTMSLQEVLALAGGVTEPGNPDDISIIRGGRAQRLGRWNAGAPLSTDLRSGDEILVGRRSWLSRNALAAVSTLGLVVSVAVQVFRH